MPTFNQIPNDNRVPGMYVEVDGSNALQGTPAQPHTILVLGTMKSTGVTATPLTPYPITGESQGDGLFGVGWQLAEMLRAAKKANPRTKMYAMGLVEPVAGVAATGTLTVSGTATESRTLRVYVGDRFVSVAVAIGDLATAVATAIAAAINADSRMPVTAAAVGAVVTCTCRWKGTTGNDIPLAVSRREGDVTPAGITVAVVAMDSGASDPDLATAIAAFADETYDTVISGFNDATNVGLLKTEMLRRAGPMVQQPGTVFIGKRGTHGTLTTFGGTHNSEFLSIEGAGLSPSPAWLWAAVGGAVDAYETQVDPGRPRNGVVLTGLEPAAKVDRFDQNERNLLLYSGISTHKVDANGSCVIERHITSYQKNSANIADPTYLNVSALRVLAYLRYSLRARMEAKFSRHKIGNDGTNVKPGVKLLTPKTVRAEAVAIAKDWEADGHIENVQLFIENLIVQRNGSDAERVDIILPPDITNELVTVAAQIAFRL